MSCLIREMTIDDLAPVYHLGERLFTADERPNLYRCWDEHDFLTLFNAEREYCLVAAHAEHIIGFALGCITEKPGAEREGCLEWLGVDPQRAGQGIGTQLLGHLTERFRSQGVRTVTTDTEATNTGALAFFKRHGFQRPVAHVYLTRELEP